MKLLFFVLAFLLLSGSAVSQKTGPETKPPVNTEIVRDLGGATNIPPSQEMNKMRQQQSGQQLANAPEGMTESEDEGNKRKNGKKKRDWPKIGDALDGMIGIAISAAAITFIAVPTIIVAVTQFKK